MIVSTVIWEDAYHHNFIFVNTENMLPCHYFNGITSTTSDHTILFLATIILTVTKYVCLVPLHTHQDFQKILHF